jgi:hypothetical protein
VSSCQRERGFVQFLLRSFDLLEEERRDIYAELCRRLAPRVVELWVDGTAVTLGFSRHVKRIASVQNPQVEVHTDSATILALIDAQSTLIDGILYDRIGLRGETDDLLAFHDGLMAYVHGAVRSPSFPRLLREFRRRNQPEPTGSEVMEETR